MNTSFIGRLKSNTKSVQIKHSQVLSLKSSLFLSNLIINNQNEAFIDKTKAENAFQ